MAIIGCEFVFATEGLSLYEDRVGRTYLSLFRRLVLCNFFQFTVLALSFLWIILLTPNTVGSQIAERFWEASLVQVVFKNATAVAFHSVEKNKQFFKRFEVLWFYAISCIRQPVAQELDKIHVLYVRTCVNLLRESVSPNYKPARQIWPGQPFQPALENILSFIKNNILRNICWFDRILHIPKELRCMICPALKTVVQYVMWPLDEKVWRPCLRAKLSLGFDWTYVVGH